MLDDVFDMLGGGAEVVAVETGVPVRTEETFLGLNVLVTCHCLLILETMRIYIYQLAYFSSIRVRRDFTVDQPLFSEGAGS